MLSYIHEVIWRHKNMMGQFRKYETHRVTNSPADVLPPSGDMLLESC